MSQSEYRPSSKAALAPAVTRESAANVLRDIYSHFSPWFWGIVIFPIILAALYLWLVASDQYMSEARFIVRSQNQQSQGLLGTILQSTGMESSSNDASAVESFITSREAVRALEAHGLRNVFSRPEGDFITRFPGPFSNSSFEQLYRHYGRFVDVTMDSSTGVTTLQVKAYRPDDARAVATALLQASEQLVNHLNARAEADTVAMSQRTLQDAGQKLAQTQVQLTNYRYRQKLLDPKLTSSSLYGTLGGLMTERASVATQLATLTSASPANPSIPSLRTRLAALNGQFNDAMSHVTGSSGSLAGQLGEYERLSLEQDMATKMVESAAQSLETARLDAQRKHLYIEHIAEPSLPDYALYPRRLVDFLIVMVTCLVVYGIAWLLLASVREHGMA